MPFLKYVKIQVLSVSKNLDEHQNYFSSNLIEYFESCKSGFKITFLVYCFFKN